MRHLLILFSLMLLSSVVVLGQNSARITINGVVKDRESGEPLVGALVSSSIYSAIADADGHYVISLPAGDRTLICAMLGYKSDEKRADYTQDITVDFLLEQDYVAINGIIVFGTDKKKPLGASFGKIEVNMKQLQFQPLFLGEQDIFKYLQLLPGVTGGKDGSSNLNIRGGSADQTLILLDDIPIYNQNHALGFISVFNGDVLSGAELYKGNIPAVYGGRLSGVASMTTRNGSTERHKQMLGIGTLTASFTAEGPIGDKGSYLFSGRYFTPNLLLYTVYGIANPERQTNYLFFDVTGRIHFRIDDRNALTWGIYSGYDAMSNHINQYETITDNDGVQDYDYNLKEGIAWGSLTSSLKLTTRLKGNWHIVNSIYYSGMMNHYTTDSHDSFGKSLYATTRSAIGDLGARSVFSFNTPANVLKLGIQLNYQSYVPKEVYSKSVNEAGRTIENRINNGNKLLYNATLFVDGNSDVRKWRFHYGLRLPLYYNGHDVVFTAEPRVGVSFDADARNEVYLSYDRSTQPLFSLTKQFMGVPMDLWLPYQSRMLQSSDQLSAGWKFRPIEPIFISIEIFWKKMNNLYFVKDEDSMLTGHGGYDIGYGNAVGGEFILQYTGRTNTVMLSYTQSTSKRFANGQRFDFAYDIPYNLNVYFQQRTLQRGDKTHYFSVNINFHAGIPYIASYEIYPVAVTMPDWPVYIPNNPNYPNVRLPDYFRIDLNYSMERKLKRGKRVWQFSILNVTNHFNPQMIYIKENKHVGLSLIPIMPSFSFKRYW